MNTATRLLLAALLALPFLGACKKEEAMQETAKAPVAMPADATDENAWNAYLTDVVTRNLDAATSTYVYTLPADSSEDFQGAYDRQLEKAEADMSRGGVEGTLLAFGGPNSAKSADLAVAAFAQTMPGTQNGVRVLFIGDAADSDRVKAAVEPSGATYKFVEAK